MLHFRYQKTKPSKEHTKKQSNTKRKLRNHNLDLMLKSSETLLEDYIELEVQVGINFKIFILNKKKF